MGGQPVSREFRLGVFGVLIWCCLAAAAGAAGRELVEAILVRVNDRIVTMSDFRDRLKRDRFAVICVRQHDRRRFDVGGITTRRAGDVAVFTLGVRQCEFMAHRAAHRTVVGLDLHDIQPDALENAVVCGDQGVVLDALRVGVGVQRVGIFHGELAQPDQAATRARLVAVLGLNLEDELRQAFVAVDLVQRQRRDDVLVRRTECERTSRVVLEAL